MMAAHTVLGKCSIPTTLEVGSPQRAQRSCEISSIAFPRSPSLSCNKAHSGSRTERRGARCWGVAGRGRGHLTILAGISDQNERLKEAAKSGDLQTVNEILGFSQGVSIDSASEYRAGWTALHLACFYDHPSIVERLLKAGANLETRNESGNTALQLASLRGNIDVARILLESGADIYAASADRGTALDYAQEWGGEEMVDFLLQWASKANLKV